MNRMQVIAFELVPQEYIGIMLMFFLVSGGICIVVGAKKLGLSLIITGISFPFVSMIIEALFSEFFNILPPSLVQVFVWVILIVIYLALFGSMMGLLFGKEAWGQAKGSLLADAIKSILRIVFNKYTLILWVILAAYVWLSSRFF